MDCYGLNGDYDVNVSKVSTLNYHSHSWVKIEGTLTERIVSCKEKTIVVQHEFFKDNFENVGMNDYLSLVY